MQTISRRDLLRSTAAIVVGFSLGKRAFAQNAARAVDPDQVDSFLAIHRDGSVTIYTSKVDVGTGMLIAIPQMAAEELGIPVERISVVQGDTDLTADTGGTGGSTGSRAEGSKSARPPPPCGPRWKNLVRTPISLSSWATAG